MSGRNVAIRYSQALYDVAEQKKITELITLDLKTLNEIMGVFKVREYCLKTHTHKALEMQFINTAFIPYVSQTTAGLLKIAVRNGRLAVLPYLFTAWQKILAVKSGTMEVIIESAQETGKIVQQAIEGKMQKRIKKKIKLNNIITPEIVGGIRILWDNRMIDLSAIGRLKKMRALLKAV